MAEDLTDGEFWLPSQFLSDDDILMDFKSDIFTSGSSSDLGSLTTETETSDDDDLLLPLLTRKLLGSPQSTLCGWDHVSPSGPFSPEKEPLKEDGAESNNATLDLLNKAAGEVAKMKLRTEKTTGTGFFDCSNSGKGLLYPPQPPPPQRLAPFYPPHFYNLPHFRRYPPHLMWGPVQLPPPQQRQIQNRVTKNTDTNSKTNSNNNRPLGLPPSAWPPLPGQAQSQQPPPPQTQAQAQPPTPQSQAQPMMGMFVGQQSVSVGTGVFLPRRVNNTPELKTKSDGNATKTKNNKGSQRRNSRPAKANDDYEIQLPSEWVY